MFDHLFIAEKPSLAESIAAARAEQLGVKHRRKDGYWEVGEDAVTWLFGHMYQTAPPQYYGEIYKTWSTENLPIIPEEWKLLPVNDKKKHIANIASLLKSCRHVVNAGDAGREGQLLVDELLIENGWDPFSNKTKRLWVRSVARKDLLDALNSMFSNAEKRNLYDSAVCRQRADWLLGMNMTQLFTVLGRKSGNSLLVSVGRVQTPTLKLVVDRDLEIKNFKPTDHYLPQVTFKHEKGTFTAAWIIPDDHEGLDPEGRLIDKTVAEKIAAKVDGKEGVVTSYSADRKSTAAPLPHSLSALQTECSAQLGLSAQQTLDVAQALYDKHKVVTYPRSDNRYLPTAILKDEAPKIIANLAATEILGEIAEGADPSLKSAAWNDAKVGEHHGIIPTDEATQERLSRLSDLEKKVFLMIARSFLSQFYPAMRYLAISTTVECEKEKFKATGRRVIDVGWKKVYGKDTDEEEEAEEDKQSLPDMAKGDPLEVQGTRVQSKRTKPPARFTDGTLIQAMTNIHRFVTNPEIKKRLKESDGIGTEATRASMLEKLIQRKYLQRKGKHLISTELGQSVIAVLPDDVTDPGLTAVWEGYLEKIISGEMTEKRFMAGQIESLRKRIANYKDRDITIKGAPGGVRPIEGHGETCDVCGVGKMLTREIRKGEHKGKKFLACSAWKRDDPDSCKNVKWPQVKVTPISGDGDTCEKCGKGKMRTRVVAKGEHKGKKFLACDNWSRDNPDSCRNFIWPEQKKKEVEPLEGHNQDCPKCGKGKLITRVISKGENRGKRFLSCNNWKKDDPSSCSYSAFPQEKVEKLPGDGDACPNCGEGVKTTRMIRKGDRKGERFLSCSRYPECKFAENASGKVAGKSRSKAGGSLSTQKRTRAS